MPRPVPRLKARYRKEVRGRLLAALGYKNLHQVPALDKIVLNMGVSEGRENVKAVDAAAEDLAVITGQKPMITRSKRSISNFKLRAGIPLGCKVTLRGDRMYEFLDRLINTAIPRVRDFKGLSPSGFDGRGNYNLGLAEQHLFLEINMDKSGKARGLNVTICTTAKNDLDAQELLTALGFPLRKDR